MAEKLGVTYKKGYRRSIVRILLTCGVLSKKAIHMLGDNVYPQYVKKIKEMKDEKVVDEINVLSRREGYHKTIRLSNVNPSKEKYMQEFPTYAGHYYRYAIDNAKNISRPTKKSAAIKAYRESEIVAMLAPTEVRVFPDEKIEIRRKGKKIPTYPASFYNSLEVKEGSDFRRRINDEEKESGEVIGSRAIGLLISEGDYYAVYHTENRLIKWTKNAESQIANSMAKIISERCVEIGEEERRLIESSDDKRMILSRSGDGERDVKKVPRLTSCMLFYSTAETLINTFQNNGKGKINISECGYQNMYAIPYDKNGQQMVRIMTQKDWKENLIDVYLKDKDTNVRNASVTCDATDGETFILLFCIPDVTKLKKFLNMASWQNEPEKYVIYCFDFQEEFVSSVAEGYATIMYADFKTYCEYKGL